MHDQEVPMVRSRVDVRQLQLPLRKRYATDQGSAHTRVSVRSARSDLADPLHCEIRPDSVADVGWRSGAHPAVGGDGDAPCSADLLLGSLAACQEITLRMVAANIGIELEELEVTAEADWDPRGTLAMGREFPVGLTRVRCATRVRVVGDTSGDRAERLLRSAERYCVVLNTLREGVPVESTFQLETGAGTETGSPRWASSSRPT
jgi:uncharacterized OsmC-like protein